MQEFILIYNVTYPIAESIDVMQKLVTEVGGTVTSQIDFDPKGLVATLPSGTEAMVIGNERIDYGYPSFTLSTTQTQADTVVLDAEAVVGETSMADAEVVMDANGPNSPPTPWHLDRLDNSNGYAWRGARTQGAGVNVCVS